MKLINQIKQLTNKSISSISSLLNILAFTIFLYYSLLPHLAFSKSYNFIADNNIADNTQTQTNLNNFNYLIDKVFIVNRSVPRNIKAKRKMIITAYSSTPEETDTTPFITAIGTITRNGIVAANSLSFGTKIQIPEIFGDKIFVVEDRMAPKNNNKIDIWFPTKEEALKFGVKYAEVLILK